MKVFAIVTLLLVASAQAGLFTALGNFLGDLAKNFGTSALETLKNTGVSLLKNVTSTTANMLAETGQMALFELGNAANGKRDIGGVVKQIEDEFKVDLQGAIGNTLKDSETIVNSLRQLIEKLFKGEVDTTTVLDFLPQVHDAITRVMADLHDGMFGKLISLLGRHSSKRDVGVLSAIKAELDQFLKPLSALVQKELSAVTASVETIARLLNEEDLEDVVKALLTRG
ncbi:uncharacterized protein [Littorina saxatilis]|uniref:Uncharacterized protein n=1 Tax=Littorina saxatilis TaxID=31220 RepID=A0AAN9APH9_9CAEN